MKDTPAAPILPPEGSPTPALPLGGAGASNLAIENRRLPSLCLGRFYATQLRAAGGVGINYTWSAVDPPAGIDVEPRTGRVFGVPRAAGLLSVSVTDEAGASAQQSFELRTGASCTFAHLERETETTRLHFRDVFSSFDVLLPPEPGPGELVADYEFSPDGAWLAFRAGSSEQMGLYLYATAPGPLGLPSSDAVRVPFACPPEDSGESCSVIDYAWSGDAQALAVVLSGGAEARDHLSGVDVSAPTQPWPLVSTATWLADTIPLDYLEQLIWVDSSWVGFLGLDRDFPESGPVLYSALRRTDGAGFSDVQSSMVRRGPTLLTPVPGGLAVPALADSGAPSLAIFEREVGPQGRVTALEGRVSPSGRLVAATTAEGRLAVFDLRRPELEPLESERGACPELVAWSDHIEPGGLERIACLDGSEVRIFDHYAAATEELAPQLVPAIDIPVSASPSQGRRVFSPDGRWLLLETLSDGSLSLWDLARGRLDGAFPFFSPSEVVFPKGRGAIAFSNDQVLLEYPLPSDAGITRAYVHGAMPLTTACVEGVADAAHRWCGAPNPASHIAYDSTGSHVLFEGPPGVLWLAQAEVEPASEAIRISTRLPVCSGSCSSSAYSFTP